MISDTDRRTELETFAMQATRPSDGQASPFNHFIKPMPDQMLRATVDGFPNEDKMGLHLVNLVRDRLGEVFLPYVHPHFEDQDDQRVLVVQCERGPKPAFVKDGNLQRFFVRGGNSTAELSGTSVTDYDKQRFG